jgi:hypothetical protein
VKQFVFSKILYSRLRGAVCRRCREPLRVGNLVVSHRSNGSMRYHHATCYEQSLF